MKYCSLKLSWCQFRVHCAILLTMERFLKIRIQRHWNRLIMVSIGETISISSFDVNLLFYKTCGFWWILNICILKFESSRHSEEILVNQSVFIDFVVLHVLRSCFPLEFSNTYCFLSATRNSANLCRQDHTLPR